MNFGPCIRWILATCVWAFNVEDVGLIDFGLEVVLEAFHTKWTSAVGQKID